VNWLAEAQALADSGEPFAVATVVRRLAPASAQAGAKAIIMRDGAMRGWVGGSCAQPVVTAEARKAIRDGAPRLLRLGQMPGAGPDQDHVVEYPMTCHSGGALEILIEPVLPATRIAIVGETPIAETLASLASVMGYTVSSLQRGTELAEKLQDAASRTFVVVASMGVDDEEALAVALRAGTPYVALVASPKRSSLVRDTLLASGLSLENLARLKAPAGLDIGASTQEEIALSIMAEIVQLRAALPSHIEEEEPGLMTTEVGGEATDPVCGMSVTIATARHRSEYGGTSRYFCCGGCKKQFDADPIAYAAA
jgi:xanthine dehydrogenase accessory factor